MATYKQKEAQAIQKSRVQGRVRGLILTVLGILAALVGLAMLVLGHQVKGVMVLFGLGFLVCFLGLMQYRARDH